MGNDNLHYVSTCGCGAVHVDLAVSRPLDTFQPRACDCDFCTARNAAYLSDPNGSLQVSPKSALKQFKHGSEQARFWVCSSCHELVAVTCEFATGLRGAVNARIFEQHYKLKAAEVASPKHLSDSDKRDRWRSFWFPAQLD